MKKPLVFFILLIIVCCFGINFYGVKNINFASGIENCNVLCDGKYYQLNTQSKNNISKLRAEINNLSKTEQVELINKIMEMGFSLRDAINYVYPNFEQSVNNLYDKTYQAPIEPTVEAEKNNCKIIYKNAKNGVKIDKNIVYSDFFEYLCKNLEIEIKKQVVYPENCLDDIKNKFVLVSEFKTSFAGSGESRVNNIKLACESINGLFIKAGEIFSFNKATGNRTVDKGYKEAKIIKDGKYVDGFGGGVCQVSTTLYNACIRAGLTATEVYNHSLPSSYISPCFDAMVSMGSADLKIKNNKSSDFIITCSTINNECRICLYGVANEYQIQTRYEIYENIPAGEDIIETDASKYNGYSEPGEYRISYPADGYRAKGYLDYYKDGVLIKSEKIRDNTYKAKQGIVLVVE